MLNIASERRPLQRHQPVDGFPEGSRQLVVEAVHDLVPIGGPQVQCWRAPGAETGARCSIGGPQVQKHREPDNPL